jgi:protein-tyrosine phosphatase
MTLKALVEILIHFDNFRNIDLYYQGLYYAKIKVYNNQMQNIPILKPDSTTQDYSDLPESQLVSPYWHFPTER